MNTCYSHNEEDFYSDPETALESAVEIFLGESPDFEGETDVEIFEGVKTIKHIGDFAPDVTEEIGELAYGEHDEHSEYWSNKIHERRKEIKEIVRSALNKWADENNMHPNFYGVGKVTPIFVKIKVDKDGSWTTL